MPSRGARSRFSSPRPTGERLRVARLQQHAAGPEKSNTQPSPDFIDWIDRPCDRPAHLEPHVERVRDDVPGVDGDRLAGLEVDDVDRAVDAHHRLALPLARKPNPPSPPNRLAMPPHWVSISTPWELAIQLPRRRKNGCSG